MATTKQMITELLRKVDILIEQTKPADMSKNPFVVGSKGNAPPGLPTIEKPSEPPLPYPQEAVWIKEFIQEGRPLDAKREEWMKANPQYFTAREFAEYLPWIGAVGGDVDWLQLGIGWYADPNGPLGATLVLEGEFNPYGYESTEAIYAAYKRYREAGGKPQAEV